MTAAVRAIALKSEFDGEGQLRLEATVGDRRLKILATDDSRKIDVNRAFTTEIAEGFTAQGADAMTAQTLSRRVIDWRDADEQPQPGGAEAADYLTAAIPAMPRNDRFVSLDEIETVMGMPLEIAARLPDQRATRAPWLGETGWHRRPRRHWPGRRSSPCASRPAADRRRRA